jgi:hypothetical protein
MRAGHEIGFGSVFDVCVSAVEQCFWCAYHESAAIVTGDGAKSWWRFQTSYVCSRITEPYDLDHFTIIN